MGCGSSSVKEIEVGEFAKMNDSYNKMYQKVLNDEKKLDVLTENYLTNACEKLSGEEELKDFLEEMKESFNINPSVMSDEDIKNAVLICCARIRMKRNIQNNLINDGDVLEDYIQNIKTSDKQKLIKFFTKSVGEKINFLNLDFENENNFLLIQSLQLLMFSQEFHQLNTILITIKENNLVNHDVIKSISCFLKNHPNLKTLFLGISNENSKPIIEFNNLFYIFEAAALSKSLKNFALVRLLDVSFTIDNGSLKRLENALRILNLKCLLMINLSFKTPEHRSCIIEGICSNSNLELLGIQMPEFKDSNTVTELLPKFIFSNNFKILIIGENEQNDNLKKYESVIKKNNPSLEILALQIFKVE